MLNTDIHNIKTAETPILSIEEAIATPAFFNGYPDGKSFIWHKRKIYYKDFNINELIGMYIATYINRETVKYFLINHNGINLASYDFKDIDKRYLRFYELGIKTSGDWKDILSICPNKDNKEKLLEQLSQMIAQDIYMRQEDRHVKNYMFARDKKENISLAPSYDYTLTFDPDDLGEYKKYQTNFFSYKIGDDLEHNEFHHGIKKYLHLLQQMNLISDIIKPIEEDFSFKFDDSILDDYKKEEETSQKILSKII